MTRIGSRTFLVICMSAILALALAGCSSSGGSGGSDASGTPVKIGSPASGVTVTEKGLAFTPAEITVKVGDTVTFANEDSAPHNVSIDGKELGSQAPGVSVTWKATAAGTFPYFCVIHPSMTGTAIVQ